MDESELMQLPTEEVGNFQDIPGQESITKLSQTGSSLRVRALGIELALGQVYDLITINNDRWRGVVTQVKRNQGVIKIIKDGTAIVEIKSILVSDWWLLRQRSTQIVSNDAIV